MCEVKVQKFWFGIVLGRAISVVVRITEEFPENIAFLLNVNGFSIIVLVEETMPLLRLTDAEFNVVDLPMDDGRHVAKNNWVFLTSSSRASLDALIRKEQNNKKSGHRSLP